MSQSLSPPDLFPSESLEGVDNVINILQDALGGLTSNSLGRVRPQWVEGKLQPWIQKGDRGEYYPAYPNDTLDSFSCLYAHDDENYDDSQIWVSRTLSVIVWLNLATVAGVTVEGLKRQVRQRLRDMDCVSSVNKAFDQTVSGAQAIYPGFDVSGLEERYLTYPYAGFRMEVTVQFADLCF